MVAVYFCNIITIRQSQYHPSNEVDPRAGDWQVSSLSRPLTSGTRQRRNVCREFVVRTDCTLVIVIGTLDCGLWTTDCTGWTRLEQYNK